MHMCYSSWKSVQHYYPYYFYPHTLIIDFFLIYFDFFVYYYLNVGQISIKIQDATIVDIY